MLYKEIQSVMVIMRAADENHLNLLHSPVSQRQIGERRNMES